MDRVERVRALGDIIKDSGFNCMAIMGNKYDEKLLQELVEVVDKAYSLDEREVRRIIRGNMRKVEYVKFGRTKFKIRGYVKASQVISNSDSILKVEAKNV